ncbi:condensin complex protein MksE [Thalassotalea hakodatensis]|uniref:condensin complex protein MksE n=1 Tax=Thalassotalea hakodatensis TaxID=3030492 RepID=UPI0025739F93|nr:DNA gyrase [Thalassotalea hakodatensis]
MNNFQLNQIASQAIYKDLISGKMINETEYVDGELIPSTKFRELVNDIDKYRELYALLGFTLKDLDSTSYFITRLDKANEFNDTAANMQTILLILARGLGKQGIAPGILFDEKAGVSSKIIDEIGAEEESAQILKACGIKQPLTHPVNNTLLERGIVFKNLDDRYVLSSSGTTLFNRLFNR